LGLLSECGNAAELYQGWRDMAEKFWVIFLVTGQTCGGICKGSGNEGAADTETALTGQLFPHGLEVHANGGKNRDV